MTTPINRRGLEPWGEGFAVVDYRRSYLDPHDPRKLDSWHPTESEARARLTRDSDPSQHCFREDSQGDGCRTCGHLPEEHSGCDCDPDTEGGPA